MADKPIKTLNMSLKRSDGDYVKLGSNATWDNEKWRWSINVLALRETLQLIDSGVIEAKNGYIGGICGVFVDKEKAPKVASVYDKQNRLPIDDVKGDEIPF